MAITSMINAMYSSYVVSLCISTMNTLKIDVFVFKISAQIEEKFPSSLCQDDGH